MQYGVLMNILMQNSINRYTCTFHPLFQAQAYLLLRCVVPAIFFTLNQTTSCSFTINRIVPNASQNYFNSNTSMNRQKSVVNCELVHEYKQCVHVPYISIVYIYTYLNMVYMYTNIIYIYIYIKYGITKQIKAMTEEDSPFSFFTVYYSKSADKSQVHGKIMSSCNINKILHLTTLNYSMLQQSCPQATVTPPPPIPIYFSKNKKDIPL